MKGFSSVSVWGRRAVYLCRIACVLDIESTALVIGILFFQLNQINKATKQYHIYTRNNLSKYNKSIYGQHYSTLVVIVDLVFLYWFIHFTFIKADYIYYNAFSTQDVSVPFIKRDVSVVRILFRSLIWAALQIHRREKYNNSILKISLHHILFMIRNKGQNLSVQVMYQKQNAVWSRVTK